MVKGMETERLEDRLLVQRLLDGSEESWAILYRKYQGPVFRFALHMTGSREVAEEAVQETFVAFLARAAHFDPAHGSLQAYLTGIARNQAFRLAGKRWREAAFDSQAEPAGAPDPFHEASDRQLRESLRKLILGLPEPYRVVVVLCEIQEMSYEEAASVLNCPVGTIRSRLHRARQMLTERMVGKGCPA